MYAINHDMLLFCLGMVTGFTGKFLLTKDTVKRVLDFVYSLDFLIKFFSKKPKKGGDRDK